MSSWAYWALLVTLGIIISVYAKNSSNSVPKLRTSPLPNTTRMTRLTTKMTAEQTRAEQTRTEQTRAEHSTTEQTNIGVRMGPPARAGGGSWAATPSPCPSGSMPKLILGCITILPVLITIISLITVMKAVRSLKRMNQYCEKITTSAQWISRTAVRVGISAAAKKALVEYAHTKPELTSLLKD